MFKSLNLESKKAGFFLLFVAIILEAIGSNCLKLSNGFQLIIPSIIFLFCYVISFSLLILILKSMPLGLAYGIWGGAGTFLTAFTGVFCWKESLNGFIVLGMILIVLGIIFMAQGDDETGSTTS